MKLRIEIVFTGQEYHALITGAEFPIRLEGYETRDAAQTAADAQVSELEKSWKARKQ